MRCAGSHLRSRVKQARRQRRRVVRGGPSGQPGTSQGRLRHHTSYRRSLCGCTLRRRHPQPGGRPLQQPPPEGAPPEAGLQQVQEHQVVAAQHAVQRLGARHTHLACRRHARPARDHRRALAGTATACGAGRPLAHADIGCEHQQARHCRLACAHGRADAPNPHPCPARAPLLLGLARGAPSASKNALRRGAASARRRGGAPMTSMMHSSCSCSSSPAATG